MQDSDDGKTLFVWAVYEKPKDYPEKYVARRWAVRGGVIQLVDGEALQADSLEALRALLPRGLYRMPAQTPDDPCIVETWL